MKIVKVLIGTFLVLTAFGIILLIGPTLMLYSRTTTTALLGALVSIIGLVSFAIFIGLKMTRKTKKRDLITKSKTQEKSDASRSNNETQNLSKIFYIISLALSYLIITGGNFFFAGWMLIAIPIFALWLTCPIFLNHNKENNTEMIISYVIWVLIQWAFFYFGLGPPEGVGVPRF